MINFQLIKRFLIYKLQKKINIDKISLDFNKLSIDEIFTYFGCNKATELEEGKILNLGKSEFNYGSWLFKDSNKKRIIGHGYGKFYEKYLKSFKGRELNILEIGSFAGASAASFVKFFPLANIYCLDKNLTNFKFISKNIKVFSIDITKKKMVKDFFHKINISKEEKYFDIIIDDASHKLSHMLIALNFFYKNLRPGGFYIIEDYMEPNHQKQLYDCQEMKIDEILNCIKNKKKIDSKILNPESFQNILIHTENVFTHNVDNNKSNIAFIKKLN